MKNQIAAAKKEVSQAEKDFDKAMDKHYKEKTRSAKIMSGKAYQKYNNKRYIFEHLVALDKLGYSFS